MKYFDNINLHNYTRNFPRQIFRLWELHAIKQKKLRMLVTGHFREGLVITRFASGYVDQSPAWVHATFQYMRLRTLKITSTSRMERGHRE